MSKSTQEIITCDQCGKHLPSALYSLYLVAPDGDKTADFCRLLCLARWAKAEHVRTRKPRSKRAPREPAPQATVTTVVPDGTGIDVRIYAQGTTAYGALGEKKPTLSEAVPVAPTKRKRGRPKKQQGSKQREVVSVAALLNTLTPSTSEPAKGTIKLTGSNQGALSEESLIEPCPHCGKSLVDNRILSDHGSGKGLQETCLHCMKPIDEIPVTVPSQ